MSDLDIRLAALSQEYEATITAQARRMALLNADLASARAELETAKKRIAELEKPAAAAPLHVVPDSASAEG